MGNVKGIRKYSVLERRPQNGAFGRAALCGCEPGFVRSLSEATSEPCALCNVSWRAQRTTLPLWIQKKPLLRCSVRMGGQ